MYFQGRLAGNSPPGMAGGCNGAPAATSGGGGISTRFGTGGGGGANGFGGVSLIQISAKNRTDARRTNGTQMNRPPAISASSQNNRDPKARDLRTIL